MRKYFSETICAAGLIFLSSLSHAATAIDDAEASFVYISSTLQTFKGSGRLLENPGIDEADSAHFIAALEQAYQRFSRDFNSDSAMCSFYRDPENGRMTIEERAELSFLYMRNMDDRLALFRAANAEFQQAITDQFGRRVLDNINGMKLHSVSNQWLPAAEFDEAARINFLDAMCS
ncbi:MAG: hypothetical protein WDZ52_00330 [Pseudohongiellaceae bacterium]